MRKYNFFNLSQRLWFCLFNLYHSRKFNLYSLSHILVYILKVRSGDNPQLLIWTFQADEEKIICFIWENTLYLIQCRSSIKNSNYSE